MRLAIWIGTPARAANVPPQLQPPRQNRSKSKRGLPEVASPPVAWSGFLMIPVAVLLGFCVIFPLWQERTFCFSWTPQQACRRIYGPNPFLECPLIADYLSQHTTPDQTVAVIGSEPEVYFYVKPQVGHRLHLYVRPDGSATVRRADAT